MHNNRKNCIENISVKEWSLDNREDDGLEFTLDESSFISTSKFINKKIIGGAIASIDNLIELYRG